MFAKQPERKMVVRFWLIQQANAVQMVFAVTVIVLNVYGPKPQIVVERHVYAQPINNHRAVITWSYKMRRERRL